MTTHSDSNLLFPPLRAFPSNQQVSFYECRFEGVKEKESLVKLTDDPGMSLRDYFATKAMQGMCVGTHAEDYPGILSEHAYRIADAMLKERAK